MAKKTKKKKEEEEEGELPSVQEVEKPKKRGSSAGLKKGIPEGRAQGLEKDDGTEEAGASR